MGQCVKLKWNRKNNLKMSTREYAKLVEADQTTINKLECDEEYWDKIPETLRDRIYATFKPMAAVSKAVETVNEVEESLAKTEEKIEQLESSVREVKKNGLNEQNEKTLTLVEFIFEELKNSKKHSDFKANIGLLNRALSKY